MSTAQTPETPQAQAIASIVNGLGELGVTRGFRQWVTDQLEEGKTPFQIVEQLQSAERYLRERMRV
jgi:hypothetical protein